MRYALNRNERGCFIPIYENTLIRQESVELVVPDIREDVGVILDVRGQLTLVSKKLSEDMAEISAVVFATALYRGEEGEKLECVSATIPVEFTITEPGIDEETRLPLRLELRSIEAKALNPRKLLFKAQVSAALTALIPDNFSLCDDVAGENADCRAHILTKQVRHSLITGVQEKTFSVSEEYALPEGIDDTAHLIHAETRLCVEDVKTVGTKLVFKAKVLTSGVFMTQEGLRAGEFSSSFSQIIEMDRELEGIYAVVGLELMTADFTRLPEGGDKAYAGSFRICATALCTETVDSDYIADAYSNRYQLQLEKTELSLKSTSPERSITLSLTGKLPASTQAHELCYIALSAGAVSLEGGKLGASAVLTGVKSSDGELSPVCVELSGGEALSLSPGQTAHLNDAKFGSVEIDAGGELCLELTVSVEICQHSEISAISGIEYDEQLCLDNSEHPSLIVLCAPGNDVELWDIARKYGSTVEAIERANGADDDFSCGIRPLLIPKAE